MHQRNLGKQTSSKLDALALRTPAHRILSSSLLVEETMASSSSPSPLVSSSDTASAPLPPLRSSRAHCWEARDAFFGCLDRNNIVDSIRDKAGADEKCGMEEKKLRGECVASWVRSVLAGRGGGALLRKVWVANGEV